MLKVDDIHTYYGGSHVLQGVSLAVERGQVSALLGRNGVGKTTTINSIIGFVPPQRGAILLDGENVAGWSPHRVARRGVGLVPQGRGIFPTLTVRENLTLAARGSGWTEERVLKLFPNLGGRLENLGSQLSGGEQQMLAIGRSLLTNPRLLLLDEPSEGLAPLIVREIGRIIAQLRADGLAILLVEQNIQMALDVADVVYVMSKGKVEFAGTAAGLREDEALLGSLLGV